MIVALMDTTLAELRAIMPRLPEAKAEECLPHLNAAMREFEIDTPARVAALLAQLAHESGELRWWEEMPHRGYPAHPVAGCRACRRDAFVIPNPGHEAGAQYEGRRDLGNTHPGDGVRFRGRGPIQLTGRANYRAASLALFQREPGEWEGRAAFSTLLEDHPERVADPDVGFRVAGWFWSTRTPRAWLGPSMRQAKKATTNDLADLVATDPDPAMQRVYFDAITRAINGGLNGANERWAYYLRACEVLGVSRQPDAQLPPTPCRT